MTVRGIAIVLAAASLGVLPCPAFAQGTDAPAPEARTVPAPAAKPVKKSAKRSARPAAGAVAAPAARPAPIAGGETEGSSMERRRRAFFATPSDEGTPGGGTPSAGVTLGGSGGLSPGMGFKF